jgi:AcrR family transcriptional regulator
MNETTTSAATGKGTNGGAPVRPEKPIPIDQADHRSTPERLLDAAEHLFAEKGFADTSVRDLTAVADCNIAAVNYHFNSKEKLYIEVFRRAIREMREHRVGTIRAVMDQPGQLTCEQFVRAFADSFVEPMITDPQRGDRLMQLYSREMAQPLLPDEMFHREMFEPISAISGEALSAIYPTITPQQITLSMLSLVGQLVHLVQMKQCLGKAGSELIEQFDLPVAVDHVVRFTTAGIQATVTEKESK